jgi:hypothetical protein
MAPERVGFVIGLLMGALICVVGVVVAFVLVIKHVNKKVEAKERERVGPPPSDSMVPLLYVASFMFWPVAFIAGAHLLGNPHTARAGRNCIAIGFALITLVTVLTSVAIVIAGLLYGDKLPI